jgi:hypothetical protein
MSDARPGSICLGVSDNGYVVGTWQCEDTNGADAPNSAWLLDSRPDGYFRLKNLFNENKNAPRAWRPQTKNCTSTAEMTTTPSSGTSIVRSSNHPREDNLPF